MTSRFKPAMGLEVSGLKCDAEGCDYRDPEAGKDGDWAALVDTPCPKCGASLLTEADYKATMELFALAATINAAFGPVESEAKSAKFRAEMNGTGEVKWSLADDMAG